MIVFIEEEEIIAPTLCLSRQRAVFYDPLYRGGLRGGGQCWRRPHLIEQEMLQARNFPSSLIIVPFFEGNMIAYSYYVPVLYPYSSFGFIFT